MNFVTGGTGLLGSRLLYDLLSNGEEVLALRRAGSNLNEVQRIFEFLGDENQVLFKQIKWVEGDVNDLYGLLDFMSSCERVYHAAAVVSFHRKDADELMRINVEGTKNMVNAALDSGIEKFCHVSSTAALGRSKPDGDFTEKEEWKDSKWNTAYANSKYQAELEVWRGVEEGLDAVIVNPSVIIGPSAVGLSSGAIIKHVSAGLPFYPPGANAFVGVSDVSKACMELMNSSITAQRFLVTGENRSFKNLFAQVALSLDMKAPKKEAQKWQMQLAWALQGFWEALGGKKASITKESLMSTGNNYRYSSGKLLEAIDFGFTPLNDDIEEAVQYFLSRTQKT